MKAVKMLGRMALGLLGLVVLLFLSGVAINWADRPPSPEALAFRRILDARPQVPEAENAFLYQLGIAAPANEDPQEVGALRYAWLSAYTDAASKHSDPLTDPLDLRAEMSAKFAEMEDVCREDDRKACAESFLLLTGDWEPNDMEKVLMRRYRTLLGYLASREIVPLNLSAPLPSYADAIRGQRMHLLALMQLAKKGEWLAVREGLEADAVYWRAATRNAQSLISKMIGLAGLRHHYFFSNLILREIPADRVVSAIPPDWRREYVNEDRSLRLAMAGEVAYHQRIIRDFDITDLQDDPFATPTMVEKLKHALTRLFFKGQATANGMAAKYAFLCTQFERPMREYEQAAQALQNARNETHSVFVIYNPAGNSYLQAINMGSLANYAYRAASPEGTRRAALLTAEMRARRVMPGQITVELEKSALRDPYTDQAFDWDAQQQSVVFAGPELHQWRRHEFLY